MSDDLETVVCPVCKKDQSIQRVPAIVSAGTVTGTFSGASSGTVRSGDQRGDYDGYTNLSGTTKSDLVRLLEPPTQPKIARLIIAKGNFWLLFVLLGLGSCGIFSLVMLGMLFFGIAMIGDGAEERAKYSNRMDRWRTAMARWDRLYYCHRDGITFDPVTGEHCQPANTQTFVYQQPAPSSATI